MYSFINDFVDSCRISVSNVDSRGFEFVDRSLTRRARGGRRNRRFRADVHNLKLAYAAPQNPFYGRLLTRRERERLYRQRSSSTTVPDIVASLHDCGVKLGRIYIFANALSQSIHGVQYGLGACPPVDRSARGCGLRINSHVNQVSPADRTPKYLFEDDLLARGESVEGNDRGESHTSSSLADGRLSG